ncbi:MAG: NAAT family transporter [Gammaproteobacteria bacterium]|nr:NAAT family transporter [Gammaproteobacteria bacterium]
MFDELVKFFVVLLVVVEPLSVLPVLAGLTEGADEAYRRRMSFKAVAISVAVCLVFAVAGTALLDVLGISVDAFKVGGGILLFLLAVEMVFARPSGVRSITPGEDAEAHHRGDISVFPLAFPLLAGPGALATILLAFAGVPFGSLQFVAQIGVILLVMAITLALLLVTTPVMRLLGVTGGAVLSRLLGVLLAALASQFVLDGIRGAIAS